MKARIKFIKKGNMKFVGHLDVMRYFQKAIRRSGIDIEYSKGYSPHQIMSFAAPLGIGLTSDGEYMDIQLNSCDDPDHIVDQLNTAMNDEIRVVSFHLLADNSKNAMSLVSAADYQVSLKEGYEVMHREDWKERFTAFLQQDEIIVLKKTKRSEKEVDIRPYIYAGSCDKDDSAYETFYLQLATGSENNLKPELVMEAFCIYCDIPYSAFAYQVNRMEVYGILNEEGESSLIPLEQIGLLEMEGKSCGE